MAIAIVDVAQTTVADTMPFKVGWIVEILSVTPGQQIYNKGQEMYFALSIKNIAKTTKTVTLTLVVYDACGVPIGQIVIPNWQIEAGAEVEYATMVGIPIPTWTFISPPPATVYANSFTDLPINNGVPTCPEVSAEFMISAP
jgi:hypothetical protein